MPEELVVRQCAPTLAGLKTGSLFRAACTDKKALLAQIRDLNQRLREKGLCLIPLRFRDGNALLYLYRPARLKIDLKNELARRTLGNARGISMKAPSGASSTSSGAFRVKNSRTRLGSFSATRPRMCRALLKTTRRTSSSPASGRSTGDEAYARAAFAKYKKCTDIYCRSWRSGASLEALTVAG